MKNFLLLSSMFVLPLAAGGYILKDIIVNKYKKNADNPDNTRFGTLNYGLNWGSKTDEIVSRISSFTLC